MRATLIIRPGRRAGGFRSRSFRGTLRRLTILGVVPAHDGTRRDRTSPCMQWAGLGGWTRLEGGWSAPWPQSQNDARPPEPPQAPLGLVPGQRGILGFAWQGLRCGVPSWPSANTSRSGTAWKQLEDHSSCQGVVWWEMDRGKEIFHMSQGLHEQEGSRPSGRGRAPDVTPRERVLDGGSRALCLLALQLCHERLDTTCGA